VQQLLEVLLLVFGGAQQLPTLVVACALLMRGRGSSCSRGTAAGRLMVSIMATLSADSLVDQSSSSPCSAASARLCAIRVHYDSAFTSTTIACISEHKCRIHLSRRQNKREVGRVGLFLTLANAAASEVYDVMVGRRVRGAI